VPIPTLPPPGDMIAVLMPTSSPFRLIRPPPEFLKERIVIKGIVLPDFPLHRDVDYGRRHLLHQRCQGRDAANAEIGNLGECGVNQDQPNQPDEQRGPAERTQRRHDFSLHYNWGQFEQFLAAFERRAEEEASDRGQPARPLGQGERRAKGPPGRYVTASRRSRSGGSA